MRTLPTKSKNKTSSVVYWFYKEYFGVAPDASMYARYQNKKNPKALVYLLEYDPELQNTVYEPVDIAQLVYYLEDSGVKITHLDIVTIPGLMFNYMNRKLPAAEQELKRTVEYLIGNRADKQEQQFNAPSGW